LRPLWLAVLGLGLAVPAFLLCEQFLLYNQLLIDRDKNCRSQLLRIERSRKKLVSELAGCEQKKKQISTLLSFTSDSGKRVNDPQ